MYKLLNYYFLSIYFIHYMREVISQMTDKEKSMVHVALGMKQESQACKSSALLGDLSLHT